ncbi:hypothetical protein V2J09_017919 [Rumex salicifolius]
MEVYYGEIRFIDLKFGRFEILFSNPLDLNRIWDARHFRLLGQILLKKWHTSFDPKIESTSIMDVWEQGCGTCGKLGHLFKDCPTHQTTAPKVSITLRKTPAMKAQEKQSFVDNEGPSENTMDITIVSPMPLMFGRPDDVVVSPTNKSVHDEVVMNRKERILSLKKFFKNMRRNTPPPPPRLLDVLWMILTSKMNNYYNQYQMTLHWSMISSLLICLSLRKILKPFSMMNR